MGIEEVAEELYGLAREDFTGARNAMAKAAKVDGDLDLTAAVMALRKPTAGAWLLNQLVREHRGEVDAVLALGIRLRAAQGTLGATELRALDEQRRRLTRAVARQAVAIGAARGRPVSAQVTADVEETLRSAMVDPDAGAALATGLLTETFSASGLEPVDVSRVVALEGRAGVGVGSASAGGESVVSAAPDAAAQARAARAVADAESAAESAEAALGDARAASEEATRAAVEARRRREDVESQLAQARRRLADLEGRVATATDAEHAARRAQLAAAAAERSAAESASRTRRDLEALVRAAEASST